MKWKLVCGVLTAVVAGLVYSHTTVRRGLDGTCYHIGTPANALYIMVCVR